MAGADENVLYPHTERPKENNIATPTLKYKYREKAVSYN